MTRSESLANRLREVLLNGHWIANTNYKEQLTRLTWQQAMQKFGELNTIALLTFHINYYLGGVLQVFKGGNLDIRDRFSFDMPVISDQGDWEKLLESFFTNAIDFCNTVENMPDEKLDDVFVTEQYGTYLRNIEGMIEHCYYHLGQITLLKKLILSGKE